MSKHSQWEMLADGKSWSSSQENKQIDIRTGKHTVYMHKHTQFFCIDATVTQDEFPLACTTTLSLCKTLCYGKWFGGAFFFFFLKKSQENLGDAAYMCLTHLQPWRLGRKSETHCNCFPDLQELESARNRNEKEK